MQEKQTKLHFKVSFSWVIQKNVVTLHSQTKSLQTYYKKRLLALVLVT